MNFLSWCFHFWSLVSPVLTKPVNVTRFCGLWSFVLFNFYIFGCKISVVLTVLDCMCQFICGISLAKFAFLRISFLQYRHDLWYRSENHHHLTHSWVFLEFPILFLLLSFLHFGAAFESSVPMCLWACCPVFFLPVKPTVLACRGHQFWYMLSVPPLFYIKICLIYYSVFCTYRVSYFAFIISAFRISVFRISDLNLREHFFSTFSCPLEEMFMFKF